MPRALRAERFDVWLKSDEDVPPAERPVYEFRHYTRAEGMELTELERRMDAAEDARTFMDDLCTALRLFLVGWRNMRPPGGKEIAYDPVRLEETAGDVELVELFIKLRLGREVPADDQKKSKSPPPCSTGKSAADASC